MTVVCQQKLNTFLTYVKNNRIIIVEICIDKKNQFLLNKKRR